MAIKIERLQMDFLWGDSKTYLVGWDKVCAPLKSGGLGVRKLTAFNKVLLGKKHKKLYRLATKKLSDMELNCEELSTKFDEAN